MRDRGKMGEDAAAKYLKKLGYKILEQNYFCRMGEIDIIARDKEYIVFVEVKLRKNNDFGGAPAAVDKRKQEKIKRTALFYLQTNHIESAVRFDVVLITASDTKFRKEDIEVIPDAFF